MSSLSFLNVTSSFILFLVLLLVVIKLAPANFCHTLLGHTSQIRRLPRRLVPRRRSIFHRRASPLTFNPYQGEEETVIGDDEFRAPSPMPSIATPPPAIIHHEPYYVPPIPTRAPPSPPSTIFGTSASSTLAIDSNHSEIWGGPVPPSMVIYDPTAALESTTGWYSSDASLGVPSTIADDQSSRFSVE